MEEEKDTEMHVDDMCQPVSKLHTQLLDLSAKNAALDDALYFLDKAMYMGQMDWTTHTSPSSTKQDQSSVGKQ